MRNILSMLPTCGCHEELWARFTHEHQNLLWKKKELNQKRASIKEQIDALAEEWRKLQGLSTTTQIPFETQPMAGLFWCVEDLDQGQEDRRGDERQEDERREDERWEDERQEDERREDERQEDERREDERWEDEQQEDERREDERREDERREDEQWEDERREDERREDERWEDE
ncbi:hypothetical protein BS47DRAFT_1357671 [Hydnum rufescens UP504]|uniref:Uncharacterized protein n=1 Tax=Hydnum rufescens UP504 TaxID=1448309 RepID=A0A9P6B9E4_9AGAM|nr:hypothetical protein BS47DRAFT_1357671 [Hydnum rufescens UP504]